MKHKIHIRTESGQNLFYTAKIIEQTATHIKFKDKYDKELIFNMELVRSIQPF